MTVFRVLARDGAARAGFLRTAHGEVPTPIFMPVGTQASVKSLGAADLEALPAPIILGNMARLMLEPSAQIVREHRIPAAVFREAYRGNPAHARLRQECVAKTRALCEELGLLTWPYDALWRGFGILRS